MIFFVNKSSNIEISSFLTNNSQYNTVKFVMYLKLYSNKIKLNPNYHVLFYYLKNQLIYSRYSFIKTIRNSTYKIKARIFLANKLDEI